MQDFVDMAEAHEWTLRRLREMAGRLTEQAYLRASAAAGPSGDGDDEAHARWMLVFDRMARGLRLSIALEARLARERRGEAQASLRQIEDEARVETRAPRNGQSEAAAAERGADAVEADRECDDDGLPADAPLNERIGRLKAILAGAGPLDGEVEGRRHFAEQRALDAARAERARRTGRTLPPNEPWDILTLADRADWADGAADRADPWRGSG